MKSILLLAFLCVCVFTKSNAQGFQGDFAPVNWLDTRNTDGLPSASENTSGVDLSSVPTSITLIGSDDPTSFGADWGDVDLDYTVTSTSGGIWSFDWSYSTNDDEAQWDQFFVLVNGVAVDQLTLDAGPLAQSGTYTSAIGVAPNSVIGFRIRARTNSFGAAVVTVSNFVGPNGILPVRLNIFNAKQAGEQVKLNWSTESEINSNYFEVERSANGKDFKTIAKINAVGNSTLTQQYTAIDNNPANGNNYYRLKQVDLDGQFVYSMIKTLKWASLDLVKIYPNPARTNITVRMTPDRNETTSISLFDGSGRLLQRRNIAAVAGSNIVTDWNVAPLAPGIYYFKVNNLSSPLRFVKQ